MGCAAPVPSLPTLQPNKATGRLRASTPGCRRGGLTFLKAKGEVDRHTKCARPAIAFLYEGSRQFKDFDEYLVPAEKFATLKLASALPLAVATDCDKYL